MVHVRSSFSARAGPGLTGWSASGIRSASSAGAGLGASRVIATRMEVAAGRYTGIMEFYAYGEAPPDLEGFDRLVARVGKPTRIGIRP